jgi:hypothetical protein
LQFGTGISVAFAKLVKPDTALPRCPALSHVNICALFILKRGIVDKINMRRPVRMHARAAVAVGYFARHAHPWHIESVTETFVMREEIMEVLN